GQIGPADLSQCLLGDCGDPALPSFFERFDLGRDPGGRDHAEDLERADLRLALRALEELARILDLDGEPRERSLRLSLSLFRTQRLRLFARFEVKRCAPRGKVLREQQLPTERADAHLSVVTSGELRVLAFERDAQEVPGNLGAGGVRDRDVDRTPWKAELRGD